MGWIHADSDAGAERQFLAANGVGYADFAVDFLCFTDRFLFARNIGDQDAEFVTAKSYDKRIVLNLCLKPKSDFS